MMDIMSKDQIIEYLKNCRFFEKECRLEVIDILSESSDSEGMINQIYRVIDIAGGRSVIVKQVMPYMLLLKRRTGQEFSLNKARQKKEVSMFRFLNEFSPGIAPEIYKSDETLGLIVMEDLKDYRVMRYVLSDGLTVPGLGARMGRFLGQMYYYTSDHFLSPEMKKPMTAFFENQSSKRLMADLLSGKNCVLFDPARPFEDEARPIHERLCGDTALKNIVDALDRRFVESRESLCHNDCHVGNIMVNKDGDLKLIDMEFSGYADPLMDLGRLASSFLVNYLSWFGREDVEERKRQEMQAYNLATLKELFHAYEEAFTVLWNKKVKKQQMVSDREMLFVDAGDILRPVFENSMQLAVLAMACRTSTDDFRTYDVRCVTNPGLLGSIQKKALIIAEFVLKYTSFLKNGDGLAMAAEIISEMV